MLPPKNATSIACSVALILALSSAAPCLAQEETVYGAGVAASDRVSIKQLLDRPEDYVGKTVRVEGTVSDVCPRMGCWIDITGKKSNRPVRFKVEDGVIEFPVEVKGRAVVAEGVFSRIELSEEQALDWARHLAEERGETFDAEKAEIATTLYRIEGTGAVVR